MTVSRKMILLLFTIINISFLIYGLPLSSFISKHFSINASKLAHYLRIVGVIWIMVFHQSISTKYLLIYIVLALVAYIIGAVPLTRPSNYIMFISISKIIIFLTFIYFCFKNLFN